VSQHFTPREYQKIAAKFIYDNRRVALFAQPGMGKTSTVYSVLDLLRLLGSNFFPVLVIAPLRVARGVWPQEARKWSAFADLRVLPIIGTAEERFRALRRPADVYTINYENIPWLVEAWGDKWPYRIVIADESTKLKSFRLKQGAKRAQALASVAKKVERWVNLTGTPANNGLKDLWGQMWFVDFGARLGHSYRAFTDRWFTINQYTRDVSPRPGAEKEIYAAIADVTMALRTEDWLDIKKPVERQIRVDLPKEARAVYDMMAEEFFAELESDVEINAMNAAVKSMKLVQIASGIVYDGDGKTHEIHDAKLDALEELIDELNGEPVLVGYHFKGDLERLTKRFPKSRVLRSDKDVDDWNKGLIPILFAHPASAGHGLNLQDGGRIVVFYTNTWDLELRLQLIERIGPARQAQAGHARAVTIYDIVANNTIDEQVMDRNMNKMSVQDALMAARAYRK
jgi:SNF2 family DNA or RNA helicase